MIIKHIFKSLLLCMVNWHYHKGGINILTFLSDLRHLRHFIKKLPGYVRKSIHWRKITDHGRYNATIQMVPGIVLRNFKIETTVFVSWTVKYEYNNSNNNKLHHQESSNPKLHSRVKKGKFETTNHINVSQ